MSDKPKPAPLTEREIRNVPWQSFGTDLILLKIRMSSDRR